MRLWKHTRRLVIGVLVTLYFAMGLLCCARHPSALLRVPGVPALIDTVTVAGFPQTWRMFAPPAQNQYDLKLSLEFEDGWTPLLAADQYLRDQAVGRSVLPRGYIRLANHLRHPIFREESLEEEPFFWNYFQQLSAHFCYGGGAIPELKAIRFYSVVTALAPMFDTDLNGEPTPSAAGAQKTEPIYERSCDDR